MNREPIDDGLQQRIDRSTAIGLAGLETLGSYGRIGAKHLFSVLGELEEIAVLAARRGDSIAGQLEDETTHRETFLALADALGGRTERCATVSLLVEFLNGLRGDSAIVGINVIGENWLEPIFQALRESGFCPELFEIFEADEARHVREAFLLAPPKPDEFEPELRRLEDLLFDVAESPEFLIPLSFFLGPKALGEMGRRQVTAHMDSCAHLGLEPGYKISEIENACRASIQKSGAQPTPEVMNRWERNRVHLWDGPQPMFATVDVPVPTNDASFLECLTIQVLGTVLSRYPRFNRVVRQGQLFRPASIRIGTRRHYDRHKTLLTTAYVENPQRLSLAEIRRDIKRGLEQERGEREYAEAPPCVSAKRNSATRRELESLLPPASCSTVVTNVAAMGIPLGWAPLTESEGIALCVSIGTPSIKPVWNGAGFVPVLMSSLGLQWDHRVADGSDMGTLLTELKSEFEKAGGANAAK